MPSIFNYPKFHAETALGLPLVGGKVYTYAPGTTTPKASYQDAAMAAANTNPVILDANGDAVIYLNGVYDVVLKDSSDVSQWTMSSVTGGNTSDDYEVDVLYKYGGGTTYTQAVIDLALAAVGTSTKTTLLFRPGTWVISSTANWSAYTNVVWKFAPGAVWQIATGTTTTIAGAVDIGDYQVFSCIGTGKVAGLKESRSVWFGGTGDSTGAAGNGTDNKAALNSAIAALTAGGDLYIGKGKHRISDYWTLANATATSSNTIRIRGMGYQNTSIYLDNNSATYALYFAGGHRIEIGGLSIFNTVEETEGTTWHGGIGLYLSGSTFLLDDILVKGFTTGVYSTNGYKSTIKRVRATTNQKGINLDGVHWQVNLEQVTADDNGDSGTPANGYGIRLKQFSGSLIACDFESQASNGLVVESSHGVSISGCNFETFLAARAILLKGLEGSDLSSGRNWTTGVKISGNRFWNAYGIQLEDGVGWVDIDANSWTNSDPKTDQLDAATTACLYYNGTTANYFRKINYTTRNHWLHGVGPSYHNTVGYAHAFTQDGVASLSALPSNGTFDIGDVIRYRTNRAFEWKCNTAGTYGTLNGSATTGTVVTATDDQVITLSDLTGIFPGAQITIAGAGAAGADLAVVVGGVDTDNLKAHFYPAASTSVTDAVISYTSPVFALTGEDNTVQSLDYAAMRSIDLSLGGVIAVGTLTGNIELSNPTNGVTGQRFKIRLLADGSGRNITYGTNYKGGTASLTANKRIILEFVVMATNQIVQINTPIEVD